jgi:cytosine/creatinine deaminase
MTVAVERCQLLLKQCTCVGCDTPVDIAINDGSIVDIGKDLDVHAQEVWQLSGRVVLPGFIDLHVHLDKTLSMHHAGVVNHSGTLSEAIKRWQAVKPHLDHDDYVARARQAVTMAMARGTTSMRSHVDVGLDIGLTAIQAIIAVREEMRGTFDLQVVAMAAPERTGKEGDLAYAAVEAGADAIGGAPGLFGDASESIKATLELAEKTGVLIDLHIDETDDPSVRALEILAEAVTARGLQGRVSAGHCCSLASMPSSEADAIIAKVATAELHVVSLPSVNLVLQGRGDTVAQRRGLTRIKALQAAGVNVSAGSDNVQDPFNPFGNYDLLWIGNLAAHAAHLTGEAERPQALELITHNPARAFGKTSYGINVSAPADLVVLDHHDLTSSLATLPTRYAVLKAGVPYDLPMTALSHA